MTITIFPRLKTFDENVHQCINFLWEQEQDSVNFLFQGRAYQVQRMNQSIAVMEIKASV